jgi:hypothetical protein
MLALYQRAVNPGSKVTVNGTATSLRQYSIGFVLGADGNALTVTVICARGPSHPVGVFTWLTQYEVVPAAAVEGVGAVVLAVPPVA